MLFFRKLNYALNQEDHISFNIYDIVLKIICFLLIVICIGLPINNVFSFVILFISGLVIATGGIKRSFKQLSIVFLIAIVIYLIKGILPHAAIQEGHNIFLITKDKGVLESGLPAEVYSFMKQQFFKRYPHDNRYRIAPKSTFAFSADSVFSRPKYSRIVDNINFNNLVEFRGGFVNSSDYNWYGDSIIKRENMPFFVMYELSPSSVNSSLCWTGYVLWEGSQNNYQTLYNHTKKCRKITNADIGKRVFGSAINNKEQMGFWDRFNALKLKVKAFFLHEVKDSSLRNDEETTLSIHLILSSLLKSSLSIKMIMEIAGAFFILGLMIKINWRRFVLAALIIVIAVLVVYLYCPELFGQYYIHEGGEDGITHQTLGRKILFDALAGDWRLALRGGEDVFWNTPGFRYFRALEKFLFGDTNLGYLAVILLLPYIIFGFLSNFVAKNWAFGAAIGFLIGFLPFHILDNLGIAYYAYVMVVRGGWPDALAYTTFFAALTLALRYINVSNGAYYWYGFIANSLLFVAVFMRPNLAVAALIVVLYLAGRLIIERRFKEVLISCAGFVPVLFMLFHNYFFGGKLYLFSGYQKYAFSTPPSVYFNAFSELLTFNLSGQNLMQATTHLKGLIGPWYRFVFLGAVFVTAFIKKKVPSDMKMIAIVCLSLHFVNLFIWATYFRYVMFAWALTVVVTIYLVWLWFNRKRPKAVMEFLMR